MQTMNPPTPPAGPPVAIPPQTGPQPVQPLALTLSNGKKIVAIREKKLLPSDVPELYPSTGDEAVAVVRHSPTDPNVLGLMNCSRSKWTVAMPDGSQREVESGKAVRLTPGMIINFGQTQARVDVSTPGDAFIAKSGRHLAMGGAGALVLVILLIALFRGGGIQDVASVANKLSKSVFSISNTDGFGSGFFISSDGKALTNAHVVGNDATVTVEFSDGSKKQAKVLAKDKTLDTALIQVEGGPYTPVDIDYSQKDKGSPVVAIGFPKSTLVGGLDNASIANGVVSRYLSRDKIDHGPGQFLQTNAPINHGNSGGPLVDQASGKVIGIDSAVIHMDQNNEPVEGFGFAIPMFEVRDRFLSKIGQ